MWLAKMHVKCRYAITTRYVWYRGILTKNTYITCIGEQLIDTLNDKGRLVRIYNGLVKYILAKHGAKNLTCISHHDFIRSPITQTLFLLKTNSGTHLKYKWQGIKYTHPHTKKGAQQALHWARFATRNNHIAVTILVTPHQNWYHNFNPHEGPFPDSQGIIHFKADTLAYKELM